MFPYIGMVSQLWSGWLPWYGRNYTLALEPWSTMYSNLEKVIKNNQAIKVLPGETISTQLKAFAIDYSDNE